MPSSYRRSSRSGTTTYAHVDYSDIERFGKDVSRTPGDIARRENAFYAASTATVIAMARVEAALGGKLAVKAAADMRPLGIDTVVYGGKGYSRGAEFGAYRYRQFKTWRGNGEEAGYFLWPAVRQFRDKKFREEWDRTVWSVIRKDFLG